MTGTGQLQPRPASPAPFAGVGASLAWTFASTLAAFAIQLVLVPRYARWMGSAAYGAIGFTSTIAALAQLFDFGLSVTVNRELSRPVEAPEASVALDVLRSAERLTSVVGLVLAAGVIVAAPWFVGRWLRVEPDGLASAVALVRWGGLVLAVSWLLPLYSGALAGLGQQVMASALGLGANVAFALVATWALSRGRGAVTYLAIRVAVVAVQVLVSRQWAWSTLRARHPGASPRFRWETLRSTWRFSMAMTAISAMGIFIMQFDKAQASRGLSLSDLGDYMLAAAAAGVLAQVVSPVFGVFFPRLSRACGVGEAQVLSEFRLFAQLMGAAVVPASLALAMFAQPLLVLWTGRADLSAHLGQVAALLTLGSLFNAFIVPLYGLQLAKGWVRPPVVASLIMVVALLAYSLVMTVDGDPRVPAGAWFMANSLYLGVAAVLMFRLAPRGLMWEWVRWTMAVPLGVTLAVLGPLAWLDIGAWPRLVFLSTLTGATAICVAALVALAPDARRLAFRSVEHPR